MRKIKAIAILFFVMLLSCGDEEDPYFNQDEELRIESRSLVVPRDYELLSNPAQRWGIAFDMYNVVFKEGGNVAEISVRFFGGCGTHRFALYAEDTYDDIANFDQPIDVKLYLYHAQVDEECSVLQDHTLRRVDLSFLHPGRYNLTIESTSDRTSFRVDDYEIR